MEKLEPCDLCHGEGVNRNSQLWPDYPPPCRACNGTGKAPPPASQSDRAVVAVGPITRIKGTDSISCPGLPSGMMCFGWAEQGWAINDKDGKRVATGDWGDCATIHLESGQSDEALVEAVDQPPRHVTDADRASQFISPSDGDHAELTALFRAHRNSAERELAELKGTLMKAGPIHAGPISGEHGRRYPRARQVVIEFEDGGGAYDFYETLVRLRIYFNEV